MVAVADAYAPEHLEVQTRDDAFFEARLTQLRLAVRRRAARPSRTATRRSASTTCSRPSGAARYTGGLWVGKFLKTLTYQRLTDEGTARIAPVVAAICDAEQMHGHAITARLRMARVPA